MLYSKMERICWKLIKHTSYYFKYFKLFTVWWSFSKTR